MERGDEEETEKGRREGKMDIVHLLKPMHTVTVRRGDEEGDLLSIVDSISEASGQLAQPSSTRRLRGHGPLNMKYAPLIVHGYSPVLSLLHVVLAQDGIKKLSRELSSPFLSFPPEKTSLSSKSSRIDKSLGQVILLTLGCGT